MKRSDIEHLYYITHIDNITSILNSSILCRRRIKEKKSEKKVREKRGLKCNRRLFRTATDLFLHMADESYMSILNIFYCKSSTFYLDIDI